jgi:colanic acid/amylovoran biosynthesis glycosyltransferase
MSKNPVVASYLADFLKGDMLHVYRQLTGLRDKVDAHVFTHNRHHAGHFPYHEKWLHLLPKPRLRWWRRFIAMQVKQQPWQMFQWELRRWILDLTRIDAQVLHIYFGHIAPQFIPLMKTWPHPVVVSFHGADAAVDMDKPHYRSAMQEVLRLATQIQCRSEGLAQDVVALGCDPAKVVLQRTGIPMEIWQPKERSTPPEGRWVICQSCRFIHKKGLDLTVKAFAEVKQHFPHAQLRLIGGGPEGKPLRALVQSLGLTDSVRFDGFLSDEQIRNILYTCHLYLHPSRTGPDGNREGVPNAMLEAMATGLPVVATLHGGIPEAVTDGVSGLLVPENDHHALTQSMLRVMQDPALARQLGAGAHSAVDANFSQTKQSQHLAGLYRSLMQGAKR